MEILGKILGSVARVKIMRLFLLNQGACFSTQDIVKRSRVNRNLVNKELKLLGAIDFIKRKKEEWCFNSSFKYVSEIEDLLINSDSLDKGTILETFKKVGKVFYWIKPSLIKRWKRNAGIAVKEKEQPWNANVTVININK